MASSHVLSSSTNPEFGDENVLKKDENVLKKHAAFFDQNGDGLIYPWETYKGMRAIGSGIFISLAAAIFVNVGLSGKTRPGKFPNLLFPIEIANIHQAKHGSDTDAYDNEGRFVPEKFDQIFMKHAHTHPNALTKTELKELLKANREPKDIAGWLGALAEWLVLFSLAKDENGLLQKETVRAVYDGTVFEQLQKARSDSKSENYKKVN